MEGDHIPPQILLVGIYPEPVELENLVCVFEGEERPLWDDNQIDVVVEIAADGKTVLGVETELPPNYVGPTVLVKEATLENGVLLLEGEDMRSASDLDRAPMFKEFRERNEMLYTLLQGLDWEYLASTPSMPPERRVSRTPSENADQPKRRFSLSPDPTPTLPFFDPLVPPHQLWTAIEEEVREELASVPGFKVKTGPELFEEVYSTAYTASGEPEFSIPNLVFPANNSLDSSPTQHYNYTFNHSYNFNSNMSFNNKPGAEHNTELAKDHSDFMREWETLRENLAQNSTQQSPFSSPLRRSRSDDLADWVTEFTPPAYVRD